MRVLRGMSNSKMTDAEGVKNYKSVVAVIIGAFSHNSSQMTRETGIKRFMTVTTVIFDGIEWKWIDAPDSPWDAAKRPR